jgi:protein-S-isoprenylcysteine O-methyltransferase Ste14
MLTSIFLNLTLLTMTDGTLRIAPDRSPIKRWAKLRLWIGYFYILCAVIFAQPQLTWVVPGIVLVLIGSIVRLIASATLVKDSELCIDGIYSMTRNPLYFGSALAGLGFASVASSLWLLGGFVLVLLPIYMRMISLEEKYLGDLFAESYPEYKTKVPMFLPRLWPPPIKFSGTLKITRLLKSKELITSVLLFALSVILLTWHRSWLPG